MDELVKKRSYLLLVINVLVVVLVSSNLRSPLTAVGPVLGQLSEALKLDNFQGSLLTSIPLFVFATCSVVVSRLSGRIKIQQFLVYALLMLCVGLFLRVFGSVYTLFIGSVFIGLGICIGNVITPGYVKQNFPNQIGLMTGIFSVAMNLTAALASGFSIRIGEWTGLGWQGSLGAWILVAALALGVVLTELLFTKKASNTDVKVAIKSDFNGFKSKQAWNISIFMGLQSLVFYSLISWLPAVLKDYGMPKGETGWVLFAIQMAMLPITFIGPIIANRMKNQKALVVFLSILMLLSMVLFVTWKAAGVYLSAILLGLANGLSFSLAILFFSLRTKSSANAIKLSGMAQSIGYLIAAFGPPIFGKLHDWDSSWHTSFYFLMVAISLMLYFGVLAARPKRVEDDVAKG